MASNCTPEELKRLSQLLAEGKNGESEAVPFSLDIEGSISSSEAQMKSKMGWFAMLRTMRGAFGDWLSVHAIDPLQKVDIQANNFVAKLFKEYKDATKEFRTWYSGMSTEKDIEIANALEHIDRNGVFRGPAATFDPKVIEAATKIRNIYNRLFTKYGIDDDLYRNGYRPLIRQRPSGIFHEPMDSPLENAFRSKITPEQVKFYHELERKGTIMDPDPGATPGFVSYIRGIANAKIRRPVIEELEERVVNPFFGVQWIKDADGVAKIKAVDAVGQGLWKELVHHVFGGPTPLDKTMTMTLKGMANLFGKDADTRSLYKISHGLTSAFYAGALGLRPASIIRQAFQLVPSYAELGAKYTMAGMKASFNKNAIDDLVKMNMITSPIDGLIENIGIARGLGKVVSDTSEMTMKVFGLVDQQTRAITALGSAAKFDDYRKRGIIEKLGGRKEFKEEMLKLVKQDKIKEAREAYMFENVANIQYIFGKANRPQAFRGALGNLAATLMSFPMNSFEMARMFTKRGIGAIKEEGIKGLASDDAKPLVRLILTSAAMMHVGSEYLNADLRSAFLTGAIPHSLAFPKIGIDTFQAGSSTAEWLTGNIFNVGETDFHKSKRMQSYRDFARDMRTFVPGGLFFFEDIPRAIDEGSLARMLALTPKADVLNARAKQRAQENRQAQGNQYGQLRGLSGLGR